MRNTPSHQQDREEGTVEHMSEGKLWFNIHHATRGLLTPVDYTANETRCSTLTLEVFDPRPTTFKCFCKLHSLY